MSVAMMTEVFKRYPNGEGEMLLALALADHADSNGEHIWPYISSLADKTRQSERSVQRQLRKMEEDGWLIRVSTKKIGRGQTVEYRINPSWIKGDILSPFTEEKGCHSEHERVTSTTQKGDIGDIAYKEEPSLTIKEPSDVRALAPATTGNQDSILQDPVILNPDGTWAIDDTVFDRWIDAFKGPRSRNTTEDWIEAELVKAALWLQANPKKRKKNLLRFLTGWLERATHPPPRPAPPARGRPPQTARPH